MSDQKRPFHEVLSFKLITAPVGITSDLASAKAAEVMTILDTLQEGQDEGRARAPDCHGSRRPARASEVSGPDTSRRVCAGSSRRSLRSRRREETGEDRGVHRRAVVHQPPSSRKSLTEHFHRWAAFFL